MPFSLGSPRKIHSAVRTISLRPSFPRSLNVADDYLCSLHISSPNLLETIDVINLKCHSTVRHPLLSHPTKVEGFSVHIGNSPLKPFSSLKQSHCTTHPKRLNANIGLVSAPIAENLLMQTSCLHFSMVVSFTPPFIVFLPV